MCIKHMPKTYNVLQLQLKKKLDTTKIEEGAWAIWQSLWHAQCQLSFPACVTQPNRLVPKSNNFQGKYILIMFSLIFFLAQHHRPKFMQKLVCVFVVFACCGQSIDRHFHFKKIGFKDITNTNMEFGDSKQ